MTFRNGADSTASLTDTSINPATGLATDYLDRFNEAVMLLDMLSNCPEFRDDFLTWEPMSYREHFRLSHFKTRDRLRPGRPKRPKYSRYAGRNDDDRARGNSGCDGRCRQAARDSLRHLQATPSAG
jgi:hypothetical protein